MKKPKAIKVPKTKAKDRKKKEFVVDADPVEITPPKPKRCVFNKLVSVLLLEYYLNNYILLAFIEFTITYQKIIKK